METPTASENLLTVADELLQRLLRLSPQAVSINAGLSLAVALVGLGLAFGFRRLVGLGIQRLPTKHSNDGRARASRFARLSGLAVNLGLTVGSLVVIARIWGWDVLEGLSEGLGSELVQLASHVAILLVLGFATFELASFVVDRLVANLIRHSSDRRRTAQLQTLEPLMRSVARGSVLVIFAMMILSEAGVKIGPLLAGAGVVGIAVGFGAQTIVKDVLTGLFLIVEDIVSVGDIVTIQGSGGLVEEMTLRTIRLRDFDGTLHVFPYSEAQVIHNLTKTFSYYVFEPQISYDSDIDRAIEVMKTVGEELKADPAFSDRILEPIEVVGVDRLADSGIVLKARIKTQPIQQWNVGREYNRRLKLAFDEAGIQIPYPHLRLVLPEQSSPPSASSHRTAAE